MRLAESLIPINFLRGLAGVAPNGSANPPPLFGGSSMPRRGLEKRKPGPICFLIC
jgi:hypothetical protein